jgi:hypothetical protein
MALTKELASQFYASVICFVIVVAAYFATRNRRSASGDPRNSSALEA